MPGWNYNFTLELKDLVFAVLDIAVFLDTFYAWKERIIGVKFPRDIALPVSKKIILD